MKLVASTTMDPPDYSLRPATEADLEPMMEIGHEGLRPYVEELWGWDQADQERGYREHFEPEFISIIQSDGDDIGYIKLEEREDHLFLSGIYLRAEFRNRGLGAALITDLIERCREE